MKNILITGANGFIGKNLKVALSEKNYSVETYSHTESLDILQEKIKSADIIFHLAGVNRPCSQEEFATGNYEFTKIITDTLIELNSKTPIVYTSSIQAEKDNAYGVSKRDAENILLEASRHSELKVLIFRLPNVFGKWCRPNYNSVVATFCNNIANDQPIKVNDPDVELELVYIDDVIDKFIELLQNNDYVTGYHLVDKTYKFSVGELAKILLSFRESRTTLTIDNVGHGFIRALYATYLSYIPIQNVSYTIPVYEDPRGKFAEVLKTQTNGQFSFFTAKPGVSRGGHYHHTKNEKFLVLSGSALFIFINILTGERYQYKVTGTHPEVVETFPGWAHHIENIGNDDLIVMLWANEIFDRNKPDTIVWNME